MKKKLIFVLAAISIQYLYAQQADWTNVENVFGKKGTVQGNVFKITYPRSDLKVKIADFSVAPGLALTSWVGIIQMSDHAMMMGDLVLLDSEVAAVIKKIVSENLQITAIHNHLVNESPNIKYIHFSGSGDAIKLSEEIKSVLGITATPLIQATAQTSANNPDWSKVEALLGTSGKKNGMLLQYGFPRNEKLTEEGMEMPPAMGMGTAINFQMDGNRAATTGDFVLLASEVNNVVQALTENGITVTAIHNHMLFDEPRLFMMHFWAVGDAEILATGLKPALDKTNPKK
jgi:hypothetical protein